MSDFKSKYNPCLFHKIIGVLLLIHIFYSKQIALSQTTDIVVKDSTYQKGEETTTEKTSAQDDYYSENTIFRNENFVYKKNIKTVQLSDKDWELSPPIIKLNSDQQLKLNFDDLDAALKTYTYTVIHCNSNWEPSEINPFEYVSGFSEGYISDYRYSFNTIQKYIHYNFIFPNDNFKITKSGNYILKVYQDNDPANFVLSRRFMVYDEKVAVDARIKEATIIDDRYYKQEIDFTIIHAGYEITNPYGDIKVVITQNDRWDNAITKLKPLFVKDNELVYDYDEDNVFPGGNEYRYFDMKSLRYQSARIKSISYDSLKNQVYLLDDEKRSFKRYYSFTDINGRYFIKIQEGNNSETEADYVNVHFFLPFSVPVSDGNLYVFGALSDWNCSTNSKMKYNYEKHGYEAALYLKQGYYNYEYVYLKDGEKIADNVLVEGMHYETENDYTIYVYHRAIGTYYDQLIAIKRINSLRNR